MITLKEDVWFHCTLLDWVVREGNCNECEHQGKSECPKVTPVVEVKFTPKIDAFLKEHPEFTVTREGTSYRGQPIYYATGPCMKIGTLGKEPNILKALRKAIKEAATS